MPSALKRMMPRRGRDQLVLDERLLRALGLLHWARVLRTSQLERLLFPSRRRAQKRLRALFDAGLVRAHVPSRALHEENVYTLSRLGADRLLEAEWVTEPKPTRLPRPQKLAHTLAVRDVFVAFVNAAWTGRFELVSFHFEEDLGREGMFAGAGVIPDAIAEVERDRHRALVIIEVDLATETSSSLRDKWQKWRRWMATAPPATRMLVTTPTESRAHLVKRLAGEQGLLAQVMLFEELDSWLCRAQWTQPPDALPGRTVRPPGTTKRPEIPPQREPGASAFRRLVRR